VYCYYLEKNKLYPDRATFEMSDELLERFIKQFLAVQEGPCIRFDWHGGEPTLLDIDTFRKIVRWQKRYSGGRQIANSLQTNGTLLTHEWCNFFYENDFLIGISIDGPQHIHDRYRRDCGGGPTFDKVMTGIELLKANHVEFNTLSVVNDYNARYPQEIYRFLKNIGSHYMQFTPVVERTMHESGPDELTLVPPGNGINAKVTPWSVGPRVYGQFLCAIFDEWIIKDVGSYFVVTFDAVLAKWCGAELPNCMFAEICGNGPAMEASGDIYMCDHFVYPEYLLGNINDASLESLLLSRRQLDFGQKKLTELPQLCLHCEIPRHLCRRVSEASDCPDSGRGTWMELSMPRIENIFSARVAIYGYMKKQVESNGAPSTVMAWARRASGAAGTSNNEKNAAVARQGGRIRASSDE